MGKILAVDCGGSKFGYAIVTDNAVTPIKTLSPPTSLTELKCQLRCVLESTDCVGVSFAVAGIVQDHTKIIQSPHVPILNGLNLCKWIEEEIKVRCIVCNDMEAAGWGEVIAGGLDGVRCAIVDTISTGWGGCTVIRLSNGITEVIPGEPGHMVSLGLSGPLCSCGRFGCNEARYAGKAIEKKIKQIFKGITTDACKFLDTQAQEGKSWALQLYKEIGEGIGLGWVNTLNRISSIEKIIYMGSFAVAGMKYMRQHIYRVIEHAAIYPHHRNIAIVQSKLWPDGVYFGAAYIFKKFNDELR